MRWLLPLVATQASCLAVSARAHVGTVVDDQGAGVQAGVTLGLGLASSPRAAVVVTPGVVSGTVPRLGIADGIEYVRVPRSDASQLAWRAGFGGIVALLGGPTLSGPHVAGLLVLRDRAEHWPGHEKMGGAGTSRSVLGLGVETRLGVSVRDLEAEAWQPGPGFSASLTLEWISISTWTCC
jgi:hypothetical protein